MNKERIEWVDISKGIGILLVIIGHCVYFGHFAHNWIFSFHMQLFFILSGMFLSQSSITNCFKKKFKQLIKPYIVFCIIGFVVTIVIPQWRSFSFKDIVEDIYLGYPDTVKVSSVWFLMCLFISTLMFNSILVVQKKNRVLGWILFAIIGCFGFLLGRFPGILASFPMGRMPLDFDSACVAMLFLGLGYYQHDALILVEKRIDSKLPTLLIGIITSLVISILIVFSNGTVNLHGIVYHNELLYLIGSASGFVCIFLFSIIIKKFRFLKVSLIWCGQNSLKLMGVQAIVLRLYLLTINNLTNNQYRIYFMPKKYALIGCFVVTSFSIILVLSFNSIKKKFRKVYISTR